MKIKGSTGSVKDDREFEGRHEVVLDDGTDVEMPGEYPYQTILIGGVSYVHVAEDATGRWVYRRDG